MEAIERIESYLTGIDESDFFQDRLRQDAVIRNLEVIGEAATKLPEDVTARASNIPWEQIRRMRIVMAHIYFGVNLDLVWDTAHNDLIPLKAALDRLLGEEDSAQENP